VTLTEFLRSIVTALDANGIAYMITGSLAAAVHGAGRATMDADLVVQVTPAQLARLIYALEVPGRYLSRDAAMEALAHESMFNVIDTETGWKADLIPCKARPFSQAEFARRRSIELDGVRLWIATVEDVIISKLEWAKLGGSARQLEDVAALIRVTGEDLDRPYVDHWVEELRLAAQYDVVKAREDIR
jgi:hypothetical protein